MGMKVRSIFDLANSGVKSGEDLTRKEEAYRQILEIVLKGSFEDTACLNEQKLAESFGMSRAPVREALQTLCSERILMNVPRLGYRVVPISVRETLDALDVRLLLEIESARLACRNRSESALATLDALIAQEQKISADEDDIHSWIMQGDLVHTSIAELSRNMVLTRAIVSIIDLLRRASIQLILEGKEKPIGIHYHLRILEAVRRGDEKEAEELLRKDILILRDIITQ
jgi:DNA-binding GntR family transcriptional regulator